MGGICGFMGGGGTVAKLLEAVSFGAEALGPLQVAATDGSGARRCHDGRLVAAVFVLMEVVAAALVVVMAAVVDKREPPGGEKELEVEKEPGGEGPGTGVVTGV